MIKYIWSTKEAKIGMFCKLEGVSYKVIQSVYTKMLTDKPYYYITLVEA